MKTLCIMLLLLSRIMCSQTASTLVANSPMSYVKNQDDFEKSLQNHPKIISKVVLFSDRIASLDKKSKYLEKTKNKLFARIDKEISRLKNLADAKDQSFIDSVLNYYTDLKHNVEVEYQTAIQLRAEMNFTQPSVYDFICALELGEHVIKDSESFLYQIEKKYMQTHKIQLPGDILETIKKIKTNDEAIRYYDKSLLIFYKIYSLEVEVSKAMKAGKDTLVFEKLKLLSNELAIAEDTIAKLGSYNGDKSFTEACQSYFTYLKNQNFENHAYYGEYIYALEKTREYKGNKRYDKTTKTLDQKQLLEIYARLDHTYKEKASYRHVVLNEVENASYKFMSRHMPKF